MPLWTVIVKDTNGEARYTSTSSSERAAATSVLRERYPDGVLAGRVELEVVAAQGGLILEESAGPTPAPEPEPVPVPSDAAE